MSETPKPSKPPLLRRQLAVRLIELRKRAGLKQDDVVALTGLARSTISNIENADVRVREATLRQLLGVYNVTAPELDMLVRMAKQAGRRGAYLAYADVTPNFALDFFELEAHAAEIWSFASGHVPGLFQRPDYVRAITQARHPERTEEELARSQQLRIARQEQVFGSEPPRVHVVIDEAALLRGVTVDQVDHLIAASKWATVTLQVLPLSVGPHAAMGSSFDLLRLGDTDHGMEFLYQDNLLSAVYHEQPDEIAECVRIFDRLVEQSLTADESLAFLVRLRGASGAT